MKDRIIHTQFTDLKITVASNKYLHNPRKPVYPEYKALENMEARHRHEKPSGRSLRPYQT